MSDRISSIKKLIPLPIRRALKSILPVCLMPRPDKHLTELSFWDEWIREQGTEPETEYYRKFMMSMGGLVDQAFFDGLICLDIGCGPKGSLTWLANARAAIGLDPLANAYARFGIARHNMIYLSCAAETIPFPDHYVDVVFSMNSLDHVDDLPTVCKEIRRVLKPGGCFIGSLNLNEPRSATEPWTLTEDLLEKLLFHGWERQYYQVRPKLDDPGHFGPYRYFFEECPKELMERPGFQVLWCRFKSC
jgi:ubiquinone/menaquinone biosynthesis C-methylase UbiE